MVESGTPSKGGEIGNWGQGSEAGKEIKPTEDDINLTTTTSDQLLESMDLEGKIVSPM